MVIAVMLKIKIGLEGSREIEGRELLFYIR